MDLTPRARQLLAAYKFFQPEWARLLPLTLVRVAVGDDLTASPSVSPQSIYGVMWRAAEREKAVPDRSK